MENRLRTPLRRNYAVKPIFHVIKLFEENERAFKNG
jgi:hypothetical protein